MTKHYVDELFELERPKGLNYLDNTFTVENGSNTATLTLSTDNVSNVYNAADIASQSF